MIVPVVVSVVGESGVSRRLGCAAEAKTRHALHDHYRLLFK